MPHDTAKFTKPETKFMKIFVNPSDTLIGASSITYNGDDTTKIEDFYDGKVRGRFNWEKQSITIDSFQNHPYPFRLVHNPFHVTIKEIIKYALTTQDSIKTELVDHGDSLRFSIRIYDKHMYFHVKPIVIKNDYIPEDEISYYDIWFHKKNKLPYRMKSQWHHLTFFEECSVVKLNTTHKVDFISTVYFPDDFEIKQFKRGERKIKNNLVGKVAPEWEIKNLKNEIVGLKDFQSKILLIQFTGVGCGPCHQSLPFLKQLVNDLKEKYFEFIAIETWSENVEGLMRYRNKNEINFKLLNANEKIKLDYEISSVPIFFILDENQIIKKVIKGYGKGTTDKEILEAINELI